MSKVNFGICGLGRFGLNHSRHFSKAEEQFHLVAGCDLLSQRVEEFSKEFNCQGHSNYGEFLENPEMELVIIATPSLFHVANAEQALKAGKTVLLEKPIGVTEKDFLILQQLVKSYPDKLYFCHNHRFEAAFQNTLEIISSGILGKIHVAKLCKHHQFMRRNDWQMRLDSGGGQLAVWGPHLIDQGLQLLGTPVKEVRSYLRRILTPGDGDDHVKIDIVGQKEQVVELEISNSVALPGPYCSIYGDRGTLIYGQDQENIKLKYLDPEFNWPDAVADKDSPKKGQAMNADQNLPWVEETRKVVPEINMWEYVEIELVRHLYNALRKEIPFPIKSSEALEVVRITEIIKKQNPQFKWIG